MFGVGERKGKIAQETTGRGLIGMKIAIYEDEPRQGVGRHEGKFYVFSTGLSRGSWGWGPIPTADIPMYKNLMQICVGCKRQLGWALNMGLEAAPWDRGNLSRE